MYKFGIVVTVWWPLAEVKNPWGMMAYHGTRTQAIRSFKDNPYKYTSTKGYVIIARKKILKVIPIWLCQKLNFKFSFIYTLNLWTFFIHMYTRGCPWNCIALIIHRDSFKLVYVDTVTRHGIINTKSLLGTMIAWSFDENPHLMTMLTAQKLISVKCMNFNLKCVKCHKTADFHSNLLVSLELVTEGYQDTPVWNAYMVILWLFILVFILFSAHREDDWAP